MFGKKDGFMKKTISCAQIGRFEAYEKPRSTGEGTHLQIAFLLDALPNEE